MNNSFLKHTKEYLMILIGTVMVACSVFFFLVPSHLSVASMSGLAIVLSNFIPLPVSILTLCLNIVCVALGLILIGKEFGGRTAFVSLGYPLTMTLLERFFPNMESLMKDPALDMVCYLFAISVAQSILFRANASSGGTDIIAKIFSKFTRVDIGKSMSYTGLFIAASSVLVYDAKTVILSILGTYLNGIVLDYFLFQSVDIKRVSIVSPKHEEIRKYIVDVIGSGATIYEAIGAYTLHRQVEIVVLVNKHEFAMLMDYVEKIDPKAFVTIYNCKEIHYTPKVRHL